MIMVVAVVNCFRFLNIQLGVMMCVFFSLFGSVFFEFGEKFYELSSLSEIRLALNHTDSATEVSSVLMKIVRIAFSFSVN